MVYIIWRVLVNSFDGLWSFMIKNNLKVYIVKKSLRFLLVKMGNMKQLNMQKLFTECAWECDCWFWYEVWCDFLDSFDFFCCAYVVHMLLLTVLSYTFICYTKLVSLEWTVNCIKKYKRSKLWFFFFVNDTCLANKN